MAIGPNGTTLTPYATEAGISTLGTILAYGVETTEGEKPTTFTWLERVNEIGEISLDTEQIDASATDDEITRYLAGRQDTGGSWEVTVNITNQVLDIIDDMIDKYKALSNGKRMWFQIYTSKLNKAIFVVAQPPLHTPSSAVSQNSLYTAGLTFTLEEYKGYDTPVTIVAFSKS